VKKFLAFIKVISLFSEKQNHWTPPVPDESSLHLHIPFLWNSFWYYLPICI